MNTTIPHALTAEYRADPIGMDAPRPRLSWKLPDFGARDVAQVAYRVRVATSAAMLAEPDVWDSGEVPSPQSVNVQYAGRPLEPSREYFWTVETLDNHGRRAVSEPARWRMGLLRPENWTAKWITVNPATLEDYDIHGAAWVTASEDAPAMLSFEAEAGDVDPRAAELSVSNIALKPSFGVCGTKPAILACAASDNFLVSVNGRSLNGRSAVPIHGGPLLHHIDVAGLLRKGRNTIEAVVKGGGAFLASLSLPGGKSFATGRNGGGTPAAAPFDGRLHRTVEKASPAFRRTFKVGKPVHDAVLHICGLGFYEAFLDGRRIGKKVLDPAPTDYDDRVLYSTYEVGDLLSRPGEHSLDVLVGRGAFDVHVPDVWHIDKSPWRATPCLIAQLEITCADGSNDRVATDGQWRQVGSPILWDDLREGEIAAPGLAPQIDLLAVETVGPTGRLEAMPLPGAEKTEALKPVSMRRLDGGNWVFDFGQNMSGWARMRLEGLARGDVVTVQYGEKLGDGGHVATEGNDMFFRYPHSVLRLPGGWLHRDRFVASGASAETYEPKFSYKGFRYAEVGGLREPPCQKDVEAYQINTAFRPAGSFECSSDLLNRIHRLFVRAYMSNFTDGVPTDCPQREKNGWTGDAQLAAEMGQYCFENTAGYEKWCRDIVDAQLPDGGIPRLVPFSGWGPQGGGPAWDCAVAVVPWTLYRYRGDRRILEETYPTLRRYIEWGEAKLNENGLADYGFGDWCAPMPAETWWRYTPRALTSTAWWRTALCIASREASLLGFHDDAERFKTLAQNALEATRRAFEKPDGTWADGTQCAQACAISAGLVSPGLRDAAGLRLAEAVEATGRLVKCGILGVKWLFRALCETGRGDLAVAILSQTARPSFGDWISRGATTAWESWDDPTSQNHVMFGDVSAWLFQYPGGIRLDDGDDAIGFRKMLLAPDTAGLSWVNASHECPYGTIRSEWRIDGDKFDWTVEVPPNTTATAVLPKGFCNARLSDDAEATIHRGCPAWRIGSGVWRIHAEAAFPP